MTRALPLALLFACATEPSPAHLPPTLDAHTPTTEDLARVDVRGAAAAIAHDRSVVEALPPEAHADAVASLRRLAVSDPFTRAALQLPLALHLVVQRIPADRLDRIVQSDWHYLQQGLATHVALLADLGVDLHRPAPGAPLFGHPQLVDRDTLSASEDPLALTRAALDLVLPLARAQDAATRALIDADSAHLEALTGLVRPCPRDRFHVVAGQPWTLGTRLAAWHDALRRIEPFVDDAELAERIEAMLALFTAVEVANTTYLTHDGA